jgi:hypothetical protein
VTEVCSDVGAGLYREIAKDENENTSARKQSFDLLISFTSVASVQKSTQEVYITLLVRALIGLASSRNTALRKLSRMEEDEG